MWQNAAFVSRAPKTEEIEYFFHEFWDFYVEKCASRLVPFWTELRHTIGAI